MLVIEEYLCSGERQVEGISGSERGDGGGGSTMEVSRRPSTGKLLELTPLWESVLRYSRLPDHIDKTTLFSELALRLSCPEWEVRQHALRVLVDIITVIGPRELDGLMIPSVLTEIALNLGHSAPGVRKSALDVLLSYLQNTSDPEFVLRSVVSVGLDSPTANGTLASNVISSLPSLIDTALSKGTNISHQSLVHLVTAISKKLAQMSTQQEALDTLSKIRDHVGENRFNHFLESYYPEIKRDIDVLNKVYQVNVRDSGIDLQSISSPPGSDSSQRMDTEESPEDGRKVLLEEQISIGDETVTMTVTEEDIGDGDKRSSRRVRFGGEVIKVRTPDSDVTVEIQEVHDQNGNFNKADDNDEEEEEYEEVLELSTRPEKDKTKEESFAVIGEQTSPYKEEQKKSRFSQIPLPVRPALHMPHARRSKFREDIPTWDGGESLTSSSEGEQDMKRLPEVELASLSFLPPELYQRLHNKEPEKSYIHTTLDSHYKAHQKDDWRSVEQALEALPDLRLTQKEWRSVLVYLASRLSEPRPARLLTATLRALGRCLPWLPPRALEPLLPWLVPLLARRLGSTPLAAKLEAALALQGLMRCVGVHAVVRVLVSDRCLLSRSSKLRENSLLGLLYGLMTYPSTEFDTGFLTDKVITMAQTEPKRRVRQAVLETLAVLAQYVPRQRLVLSPEKLAAPGGADFSEALAARLSRRLLPVVSTEGLVLYALHIPPMTGRDVDWVLSGSGSLSSGSVRSRSQMDLAQRDFYQLPSRDTFSAWSRDEMMAVGTAVPPQRNFTYSHNYGEDRYYDQVWAAEPRQALPSSISKGSTRPLYLRYQNGQSDLQRGNVPETGFPQLSSSYSSGLGSGRRQPDLSQTWSGSRWGESPPHVSVNQSLPPIGHGQDWRTSSRWQPQPMQVEQSTKNINDAQRRIGRWSRRTEIPNYQPRIMNNNSPRLENGLGRSPVVVSRSESSLVINNELGSQIETIDLARSTPSLVDLQDQEDHKSIAEQVRRSVSSPSSATSSLASIDSQPPASRQEPNDKPDSAKVEADNEKEEEEDIVQEYAERQLPIYPVSNHIDDIENSIDIETPETKSLGTPNSEVGSMSSKTTETSGNTIESILEEKPKRRIPRAIENTRNGSKTGGRPPLFPPSLPPFDNPKDGLLKTLLQMENPEWEVVMLGLQGLVRLCRHHTKLVTASTHSIVQSLVNNIRNLRSQVSRGSCQVSKELFDKIGRFLDTEVEDLAGTLLSRMADTNKFLRGDALAALESMVDHTNPVRSVSVLINKGAKHQNALVRCTAARLLLRLAKKLGAERTLSLPRETKDSLVITTAKLLMEGSLETRRYAKEIIEVLSSDPRLFPLMSEVVPNSIQRNISKTLLKITNK